MTTRRPPPSSDTPAPDKPAIDGCRRCELWAPATQGVPGDGPHDARIVLVGEQPGHEEDLVGRPFVGPAGRLLRELLERAGIDADDVFVTNAVKHFRYELRGKRRLHKTPLQRHVAACHIWLEAEFAATRPRVIVALGATALAAVLERRVTITAAREAKLVHVPSGARVIATFHPSAVLWVREPDAREQMRDALLADLREARRVAQRPAAK